MAGRAGGLLKIMPEQHTNTETVPINTCPPSPALTSAVKSLKEELSGVPCHGAELYKFQSMSMLLM